MARQSRLSQLPERPPLPPLPHTDPEEGYRPVGAMAQREAQKMGVHLPVHIEQAMHGILTDYVSATRNMVDPFFHAELQLTWAAMQATAALGPLREPGTTVMTLDNGLPATVEWREDRLVVRCPTDEDMGE